MRTRKIGKFTTKNGQLLAGDPCYKTKNDGEIIPLKVLSGTYQVSVLNGRLKDSFCSWDSAPLASRNAQIMIIHQDFVNKIDSLKFKMHRKKVCVDSGQAGFFIKENFYKDPVKEIKLKNQIFYSVRDSAITYSLKLKRTQLLLKEQENNPEYVRLQKVLKMSKSKLNQFLKDSQEMELSSLKDMMKYLKTKKYPSYYKEEFSSEFYDIICDLNKGKHWAGINQQYGAVSMAGIGDGFYNLYLYYYKSQIVGARIQFLNPTELA